MDTEKRRLRDEIAELTEAVRELREQFATADCHRAGCVHYHWPTVPYYPPVITTPVYPAYQPYIVTTCSSAINTSTIPAATTTNAVTGSVSYS